MDGIHDLGGKHGYGRVVREADEPVFHDRWEAKVFAMNGAARQGGAWTNTDRFRHGVERIDPVSYLTDTYYGRWLGGIETLLVETGVFTTDEISARAEALGANPDARIAARPSADPDPVPAPPAGRSASRPSERTPLFAVGDRVRTARTVTPGHTRLPAYARDKQGTITATHGAWVFPDSNAHGGGEAPCELYTVVFDGKTLWGESAEDGAVVYIDLFEPYLQEAPA